MMFHPAKVILGEDQYKLQLAEVTKYGERGLETGGYIIGKFLPNGACVITDGIDAGPNARRSGASFSPDNEYANRKKTEILEQDREKRVLGEWHLHPWLGAPHPSSVDLGQLGSSKADRPWYFIGLHTNSSFKFFDLHENGQEFVEIPYQLVPDSFSGSELFSRQSQINGSDKLPSTTVSVIGLGTLGSVACQYLGCTQIGKFILADMERLETANISRHVGTISDIGKQKTEICRNLIEQHNPFTVVETVDADLLAEKDILRNIIKQSHIVVASSGNPQLNIAINRVCLQEKKPAIYGGIFAQASGGYVLSVSDFNKACFDCLFNITKNTLTAKDVAKKYGFEAKELNAQQGFWSYVSTPAIKMARTTLEILLGENIQDNFTVYDKKFKPKSFPVQKVLCATCNYEKWLEHQMNELDNKKPNKSKKKKWRWRFGWKRT